MSSLSEAAGRPPPGPPLVSAVRPAVPLSGAEAGWAPEEEVPEPRAPAGVCLGCSKRAEGGGGLFSWWGALRGPCEQREGRLSQQRRRTAPRRTGLCQWP